jgi:hypothetical protein
METVAEYLKVINDNMFSFIVVIMFFSFMGIGIWYAVKWMYRFLFKLLKKL